MPGRGITGSTVYQHALSPFALWCDLHAPAEVRDPPNEFQELLWAKGRAHEERMLATLAPGVQPLEADSEEDAFEIALAMMRQGAPLLAQAPLLLPAQELGGRADLLVRDESAPRSSEAIIIASSRSRWRAT